MFVSVFPESPWRFLIVFDPMMTSTIMILGHSLRPDLSGVYYLIARRQFKDTFVLSPHRVSYIEQTQGICKLEVHLISAGISSSVLLMVYR